MSECPFVDITELWKEMQEKEVQPVLMLDKFPRTLPRVSKLKRIGPPQNGGWFYYSPDGHIVGPFDYEEQMEADIAEHYKEVAYDQGDGTLRVYGTERD